MNLAKAQTHNALLEGLFEFAQQSNLMPRWRDANGHEHFEYRLPAASEHTINVEVLRDFDSVHYRVCYQNLSAITDAEKRSTLLTNFLGQNALSILPYYFTLVDDCIYATISFPEIPHELEQQKNWFVRAYDMFMGLFEPQSAAAL